MALDEKVLNKRLDSSWYRLLKVFFVLVIVITSVIYVLAVINIKAGIDSSYEYQYSEHLNYKNLSITKDQQIEKLADTLRTQGVNLPPNNSRDELISYLKKIELDDNRLNYIISDKDNEFWVLMPEAKKAYMDLDNTLTQMNYNSYKEEPTKSDYLSLIIGAPLSLVGLGILFWLTRRIFFYVIMKEKFWKI